MCCLGLVASVLERRGYSWSGYDSFDSEYERRSNLVEDTSEASCVDLTARNMGLEGEHSSAYSLLYGLIVGSSLTAAAIVGSSFFAQDKAQFADTIVTAATMNMALSAVLVLIILTIACSKNCYERLACDRLYAPATEDHV